MLIPLKMYLIIWKKKDIKEILSTRTMRTITQVLIPLGNVFNYLIIWKKILSTRKMQTITRVFILLKTHLIIFNFIFCFILFKKSIFIIIFKTYFYLFLGYACLKNYESVQITKKKKRKITWSVEIAKEWCIVKCV